MQTDTVTLTEFLLARIMEDEAELGVLQTRDESAGPNGVGWAEVGAISEVLMVSHTRMMAECAAKRRIALSAGDLIRAYELEPETGNEVRDEAVLGGVNIYEQVLRELTTVYADHPDYQPEWRP